MKKIIISLAIFITISSCTGKSMVFNSAYDSFDTNTELVVAIPIYSISEHVFDASDPGELDEHLQQLMAEFDIPMTMTPRVNYYLKYFTGSGRTTMQRWIDRSNKYTYMVHQRFLEEGIPTDLLVLGFTESGYNPMAYSHAGAAGMWQFMPGTGKMYGLKINDWIDERRDFEKATDAAARHLKDLNKSFGDWYLALAAYNAGAGRISSATKKHKSQDFFKIASGNTLKLETRDYVPKYLAQLIIYKNMQEYGFTLPKELPLVFKVVNVDRQVNLYLLADLLECEFRELRELNPELITPMTPPVDSYALRIPVGKYGDMVSLIESGEDLGRYKVYYAKAGESIASIAKKHGVTASSIKTVNGFAYDNIYTAKILFIPPKNAQLTHVDTNFAKDIASLAPKYYTVKKGDNMTLISRKHNIPLNTLVKLNPKVNPKKIYPGQVIIISQGGLTI